MTTLISDLVEIPGQFKPSVQLPGDFFSPELNTHFVEGYIPTDDILEFFVKVKDSFQPGNDSARARIISGTFGTGKSDLMLMLANYVTRDANDSLMQPFFKRLENINSHKAHAVRNARQNKPPFLLVLVQADTATSFSSLILNELQHSLERAGRLDLLGTTIYQAAVELIERWEQDNNPNLDQFRIILENEYQITIPQFKINLMGQNADMYFQSFADIFERIVGMRFSASDAIQRPSDALKSIAENLVQSHEYSGIFVICDEFTHLLEKLGQAPSDVSSKAIDNVAEIATRSATNPIHFTVVSLEPFSSIKASTQSGQDALERSGGRFINGSLQMTSKNVETLIGAAIQRKMPLESLLHNPKQTDELVNITCHLYNMSSKDALHNIVLNCYPFHPIATYMLPRLNARLAQNERTTFRFLWDDELGLRYFINNCPLSFDDSTWQHLLPVDYLFWYFESSLEQKRSDLSLAYEEAQKHLSREQLEGLEGRIVRALVLFEVLNDGRLRSNQAFLAQALNVPPEYKQNLEHALHNLQELSIAIPDNAGNYEINKPGRADPRVLRATIDAEARRTTDSMIVALNSERRLNDITPDIYNQESKAKRSFRAVFVGINELSSPAWIDETIKSADALVLYVIAATDNERAEAMTKARMLTKERSLIIVAIPRNVSNLEDAYRRYRACRSLRTQQEYGSEEYQKLLRDDGFVGKDYYNQFNVAYNFFNDPGNLEWYWQGEVKGNVQQSIHLIRFVSDVMKQVYSKGVFHNQQQHLALEKVNAAGKKAVDAILGSNISVKNTGKKAAEEAVLVDGAAVMGLIQLSGTDKGYQKYTVTPPTKGSSREVWETIAKYFNSGTTDLEALFEELRMPPYGLYPPVIALFLAAFYQQNSDAIDIYRGSSAYPVSVTSEEIIGIITSPKSYRVTYRATSEIEKLYLRGIIEQALFPGETVSNAYNSSAGSLKVAVARLFNKWSQGISSLVRRLPAEAFIHVSQLEPMEAQTAVEMIKLGLNQNDTAPIIQALLNDVPMALGRSPVLNDDLDAVNELLEVLSRIGQAILNFNESLGDYILNEVAQIFGAISYSVDNREPLFEVLLSWREANSNIDPAKIEDRYASGLTYALRGLTNSHSLKPILLKELPKRFSLEPVQEWIEISNFDKYIRLLQSSKIRVENYSNTNTQIENDATPDSFPAMPVNITEVNRSSQSSVVPKDDYTSEHVRSSSRVNPSSSGPSRASTIELPTEKVFPDNAKLENTFRRVVVSLKQDGLSSDEIARLIAELARRYGTR